MATQMIRVQPYKANRSAGVLSEADRQEGFCSHVEQPEKPIWISGSREKVMAAVSAHMRTPTTVRHKSGRVNQRARRFDHRCLVAGFASWPVPKDQVHNSKAEQERFLAWCKSLPPWLESEFGDSLQGMVVHSDESRLHIHFFVVGDCNQIHPGLRQEFLDGHRLPSGRDRHERHVAGLRAFQDRYHEAIGAPFGMARVSDKPRGPRIHDRNIAARIRQLEIKMEKLEDGEEKAELRKLRDDASFTPFPRSSG